MTQELAMAVENPDPHNQGYVFVPANRILSLFMAASAVREVLRELHELGFGDADIEVFSGDAGAQVLDLSGQAHGIMPRLIRNLEALLVPEDGDTFRRADQAMRDGAFTVAVRMDGREALKPRVGELFRAHGGTLIRYWKRWVVESLDH
jgi:hypothetical protein